MTKDMNYYRNLDFRLAAQQVPADSEQRKGNERFHDIIKAILLRHKSETITSHDLLACLGKPDSLRQSESGEIWEYLWRGQHMGHEYRGSDAFLVTDGRVVDIAGQR